MGHTPMELAAGDKNLGEFEDLELAFERRIGLTDRVRGKGSVQLGKQERQHTIGPGCPPESAPSAL